LNFLNSAKFNSVELAAQIAEACRWLNQQRSEYLPSAVPLSMIPKMHLSPFFTSEILDIAKIVSKTGKTIRIRLSTKGFGLEAIVWFRIPSTWWACRS
jgi:hypothetical protein